MPNGNRKLLTYKRMRRVRKRNFVLYPVAKINELGAEAAVPILEELGGWPTLGMNPGGNWTIDNFDLINMLTILRQNRIRPFINLFVDVDQKNKDIHIIYVSKSF